MRGGQVPFTIRFPTTGQRADKEALADWLTEHGEAFSNEDPSAYLLRGLPLSLSTSDEPVQGHLDVTPQLPLTRTVNLLFDLSTELGTDVDLDGHGRVTRQELWIRLADEQDRLRIAAALQEARELGKLDEVVHGLWATLNCITRGRDFRWDASRQVIVEVKDTEDRSNAASSFLSHNTDPGQVVAVPIRAAGTLHMVAWRWLAEAHPNLSGSS